MDNSINVQQNYKRANIPYVGLITDPRWRTLLLDRYKRSDNRNRRGALRSAYAALVPKWERMHREATTRDPFSCRDDLKTALARDIAATKNKPAHRTMTEIRSWKVDRSSGYLKIVKTRPKAPTTKQLKAALALALPHVPPELRAQLMRLAA